jgi:hypothetical protein
LGHRARQLRAGSSSGLGRIKERQPSPAAVHFGQ